MTTTQIRLLKITNGADVREAQIVAKGGSVYFWDCTADPTCDSLVLLADDSDMSVTDVIRDSGFEIVE